MKKANFKIIIPSYNVEKWVDKNLQSVLGQNYKNFEIFYIDDNSTDNTAEVIRKIKDDRLHLRTNKERKLALRNIVEAIDNANMDDDDIIVLVDGDDWLYNNQVLDIVKERYEKQDLLLSYGSFADSTTMQRASYISSYSENTIKNNAFRQDSWKATHLRTFKYKLWKNIKKEDLRDQNGDYFKMTWDLAIMLPMLEMSGNRFTMIKDILYVYNRENPLNDFKVDHSMQVSLEKHIRQKKKYGRIF